MAWRKGDVHSYSITVTAQSGKEAVPMNGEYSMRVDKVAGGIADVFVSMAIPTQGKTSSTVKMDGRGAVGGASVLDQMGALRLPESPVAVGGKWTAKRTVSQRGIDMNLESVYTFAGTGTVDKVRCAVIDVVTKSVGKISSTTTGKVYLESKNGHLFKGRMSSLFEISGQGAQGSPIRFESTMVIARK